MPVRLSQEQRDQVNSRMLHACAIGLLKGTLVALVSGYFFNYRYNHGHNVRFFLLPYKTLYFVSWGVIGISSAAESTKRNIVKELAEEHDLQRNEFFARELGKGP